MALTITIPGAVEATIGATAPAILTVGVGVPGATGATGATGAQGPQGDPGEGVPVGGSAGQVLAKIDGTNYNTEWVNVEGDYVPLAGGTMSGTLNVPTIGNILNTNLVIDAYNDDGAGTHNYFTFNPYGGGLELPTSSAGITFGDATVQTTAAVTPDLTPYRELTDYDFTNVADTKLIGFGMTLTPDESVTSTYNSFLTADWLQLQLDESNGGTLDGGQNVSYFGNSGAFLKSRTWTDGTASAGTGVLLDTTQLRFRNYAGSTSGFTIYGNTSITFPDTSVQTIAFPGFNNTALTGSPTAPTPATSDNDTSIATTAYVKAQAFGDRYLTSSTTSNTIGNGNKTFTIGTGLSYTPTQNITISYDASNHMHGEVLTYSTSTGVLTVDINHHTGSGTYASWVVNVGGVTPATSVAWGDITGTLSSQTDLQNALDLKANLASPTFTGTPSLPTGTTGVTQSINDNSTKLVTTAGLRDMLSDCTWSVPPISTTTTGTSGTGSSYVNIPPDTGQLVGPNVNIAGYSQKGMQMFARSNSTYGFNYTKEMRIACKMAINWTSSFTGITYTLIQRLGNTGNGALGVVGFGITINMATKVLSIVAHNGTTLTTKTTSWVAPTSGICSIDFMVKSDGTGTVSAYADGVFIDSTTGMSTTTTSANPSMFATVEINSVGTSSTANATGYIANLRTFVAHG